MSPFRAIRQTRWSPRLPDDTWFVGIDERTAILGDGARWSVHGLGRVTLRGPGNDAIVRAGDRFETPSS